jgi:hypothetical protein
MLDVTLGFVPFLNPLGALSTIFTLCELSAEWATIDTNVLINGARKSAEARAICPVLHWVGGYKKGNGLLRFMC